MSHQSGATTPARAAQLFCELKALPLHEALEALTFYLYLSLFIHSASNATQGPSQDNYSVDVPLPRRCSFTDAMGVKPV